MHTPNFPLSSIPTITEDERTVIVKMLHIRSTNVLLEATNNPTKREEVSQVVDISPERLLDLANLCALLRIKRLGKGYLTLLRACGVRTTFELAHRNPKRLAQEMVKKNKELKIPNLTPTEKRAIAWVSLAKITERYVYYNVPYVRTN